MSEHALHFVIRRGVWGVAGVNSPPPIVLPFFRLLWLVSSVTYGDDDNYATTNFGQKNVSEPPPPPPAPLSVVFRAGAMLSGVV